MVNKMALNIFILSEYIYFEDVSLLKCYALFNDKYLIDVSEDRSASVLRVEQFEKSTYVYVRLLSLRRAACVHFPSMPESQVTDSVSR
jgi:hypothetical protein